MATLAQLKHNFKQAQKDLVHEEDPAVRRFLAEEVREYGAAYRKAAANESAEAPLRTPWKRMQTPSGFWEAVQ